VFLADILTAATVVISVVLSVYSFYSIGLALVSLLKGRRNPDAAPRARFAVLIAARNEEAVIGHLVESLTRQHYPRDLFDIIVIPNNCTDRTRHVAEQAGARILMCPFPVRSKGDVLNFALPELSRLERGYDGICVIDADNLVHPDFLAAMNRAYCSGAKAAQGYRDIKNPSDTGISGSYAIHFWLINRFFNRARAKIGLSTPIGGSGFMISTEQVRAMDNLRFVTMTEDLELTIQCALADSKVAWVPDAIVYDEQPLTFGQSWKQRSRWSGGMYQLSELYTGPLLRKALRDRRISLLDLVFLYLTAHMQVLCVVSLVFRGLLDLLELLNHHLTPAAFWTGFFSSLASTWLVVTAVAFLTVLLEKKLGRNVWRGILSYWFFIMSWIPINFICLFKRPATWEQIKHDRSMRLQDIS